MLPKLLDQQQTGECSWQLTFWLDPELDCFRGHFDNHPLLPGVVQIDWAVAFAEQLLQQKLAFEGMRNVKFMSIMRPSRKYLLDIQYIAKKSQLKFCYSGDSKGEIAVLAKGLIHVEADSTVQSGAS